MISPVQSTYLNSCSPERVGSMEIIRYNNTLMPLGAVTLPAGGGETTTRKPQKFWGKRLHYVSTNIYTLDVVFALLASRVYPSASFGGGPLETIPSKRDSEESTRTPTGDGVSPSDPF